MKGEAGGMMVQVCALSVPRTTDHGAVDLHAGRAYIHH